MEYFNNHNIGLRGRLNVLRNPECKACILYESTVNVCVMGRGNPRAKIMLIGEAPGKAEAETGKPFMGKAGQLLNKILADLKLEGKVYISNVCRCRPNNNRTPTKDERKICSRLYLFPEIRIINPDMIIALGRVASDTLLPEGYVKGKAKRTYIADKIRTVLPTWHPAAFLYSGSKKVLRELTEALTEASR